MKISWLSNAPWAATGYGNQTALFVPRLEKLGHEMQITAFYGLEGAPLHWNTIKVYPRAYHPYGQDCYAAHARHVEADIIISLMDAWVIRPEENIYQIPWVPWFPVDSEPLDPAVRRSVAQAELRVVFSKFGEETVQKAGLDCVYVPHGVDTEVLRPLSKSERKEAREYLGWPDDAFIVGMVAANKGTPSRKSFTVVLEAFARFKKKRKDAVLYLHTTRAEHGENGGVNLPELCAWLGLRIPEDVMFCDQYTYLLGFPPYYMAKAYAAMDVHLLASMGEGFGIPIVEAQACGTPVIVGDWTAMPELCFSGWKIPKEQAEPWWTPHATYQYRPHIQGVVDALEQSYQGAGKEHLRKKARLGALEYDADTVTERYWKPVLDAVEEGLKGRNQLELVKF